MVNLDSPIRLNVSISLRETALMIQSLEFWASDYAGSQEQEKAALARQTAADMRSFLTDEERAALEESGEL